MSFYFNDGWLTYKWLPVCLVHRNNGRWYFSCRLFGNTFRAWWGGEKPVIAGFIDPLLNDDLSKS